MYGVSAYIFYTLQKAVLIWSDNMWEICGNMYDRANVGDHLRFDYALGLYMKSWRKLMDYSLLGI